MGLLRVSADRRRRARLHSRRQERPRSWRSTRLRERRSGSRRCRRPIRRPTRRSSWSRSGASSSTCSSCRRDWPASTPRPANCCGATTRTSKSPANIPTAVAYQNYIYQRLRPRRLRRGRAQGQGSRGRSRAGLLQHEASQCHRRLGRSRRLSVRNVRGRPAVRGLHHGHAEMAKPRDRRWLDLSTPTAGSTCTAKKRRRGTRRMRVGRLPREGTLLTAESAGEAQGEGLVLSRSRQRHALHLRLRHALVVQREEQRGRGRDAGAASASSSIAQSAVERSRAACRIEAPAGSHRRLANVIRPASVGREPDGA